jgi:hypothetical protein
MKSVEDYRTIAENCMRKADAAMDERDRPLWAAMAKSWLQLAEHRERIDSGLEMSAIDLDEVGLNGRTYN